MLLSGCGITEPMRKSESNLSLLSIGESKKEAQAVLGPADRIRASRRLENGSTFELHEYDIFGKYHALFDAFMCPLTLTMSCWISMPAQYAQHYWLQFVDGKLDRWGHAGDWQPNVTADITVHNQ